MILGPLSSVRRWLTANLTARRQRATPPAPEGFIDIMHTVFPVVAIAAVQPTEAPIQLARPDFFGTAFAVAPGVFMTAAHVLQSAREHGKPALAGPSRGEGLPLGGAVIDDWELFPDHDVALFFAKARGTVLTTWMVDRVQLLTDVSSFGYPHAVTRDGEHEHFEVVFRGYKGFVVTTRGFEGLPRRPAVYEVSIPFPEGMSGAPVLISQGNHLAVVGVVLGESNVWYRGVEQRVGIAAIADTIAKLESKTLNGRIGSRLNFRGAAFGYHAMRHVADPGRPQEHSD